VTWTVVASSRFKRRAERFRREHPQLRQRLADTLRDLATDPYQPQLRLHSLGGEFAGVHAISLTYAYRITLTLQVSEREIILLNIGSHDEVYR
jgi:mRNA-degrading endonuclease YafQ of YafQ-DinJ toxin-antitoxin module